MKEICLKGSIQTSMNDKIKIKAVVTNAEALWFEIDEKYQEMIDVNSIDAFFILYTWLAMEIGANLRVEGMVSKRLSESILNDVKKMFLTLCPRLQDINITVLRTETCWPKNLNNNATGLSGGVDSWYTALKAQEKNEPYSFYFFANTGQHGIRNVAEVFTQRAKVADTALRSMEKPLIVINSNVDSVFRERFQQRDVIGNIACVLLLQQGISRYSYSSSYSPEDSKVIEHYDMAIMDPYILPALSTERIEFQSIGSDATRIEKLQYISKAKKFSQNIYVCVEKDTPIKNCGYCFKCRRTQLALDCIGELALIKNNFDFSLFERIRSASLVGIFSSAKTDNLDLEVVEEIIKTYGIRVLFLRTLGSLWYWVKKILPAGLRWRIKKYFPYLW